MKLFEIRDKAKAVVNDRSASRDAKRIAYELGDLLDAVEAIAGSDGTPARTKSKARGFLDCLHQNAVEHGDRFVQEAFLINFVGEAMVRAGYLAEPVIRFVNSGLYFYGLNHIERFHRSASMAYNVAHADLLVEFSSRTSLKALIADGSRRLDEGRPFCLVHHYLNALKKRYWANRRASQDACDRSITLSGMGSDDTDSGRALESVVSGADGTGAEERNESHLDTENRVAVMLSVFAEDLSELQQRIYFARHPLSVDEMPTTTAGLEQGLQALLTDSDSESRSGWVEIARGFGITEKSAKREYLKALLALLKGSARIVLGETISSGFVRRMMDTLRSIIQERDLRIRDNAGRGLNKIVERWEIALRFVLNHGRVTATSDDEPGWHQAG